MVSRVQRLAFVLALVWTISSLQPAWLFGQLPFFRLSRTYSRCCLPGHHYDDDREIQRASLIAVASVDQTTPAVKTDGQGQPVKTESGELETTPGGEPVSVTVAGKQVLRRAFQIDREQLTVGDLTLHTIGLAFYSDGHFACTGILEFGGELEAALLGANVVLRVRAYSGIPQHPGNLGNMRMLWETTQPVWVPRGQPKAVSLIPDDQRSLRTQSREFVRYRKSPSYLISARFDEITHLEIVLEHRRDR